MTVPQRVDVAIVGAGLAGSTLALLLAQRGISVALVDRDTFPRDKLCGEFLSYDSLGILDRIGLLAKIDALGASRIGQCRIVGRRRTLEFEFPQEARGISRLRLDDLMFREAGSSGAQLAAGHTATALDASSVTVSDAGASSRIEARVVVGAWGRWGRFDAQFDRGFVRDRSHRHFGFKRHYRRTVAKTVGESINLYSFDRGYLGVNDVEGGETNICGLVHAERLAGHRGRWDAFVENVAREAPHLGDLFASHEPAQETFLSSDPVIFRPRSVVEQGVFLIGDASGVIDPLTGNGMAMAIQSALLAAPHVVQALTARGLPEERYRAQHHEFFASRIRWSRAVAPLLSHPLLIESALAVAPFPAAGRLFLGKTRAPAGAVERLAAQWFC